MGGTPPATKLAQKGPILSAVAPAPAGALTAILFGAEPTPNSEE